MKIAIIASNAQSIINFRGKLIECVLKKNLQVTVVLPKSSNEKDLQRISLLGAQYKLVPMSATGLAPISDVVTFFSILFILKKIKPTHVLAYTIKPVIYGIFAARCLGIKNRFALITGLGYVFLSTSFKGRLLRRLVVVQYKAALKRAKAIIFQNPDDQKEFLKCNIADKDRSNVVNGSGVDTDYYQLSSCNLSLPISFLLMARLLKDKGVYEYINAAREIKKKYPEVVFKLLGYIDTNPAAIKQTELDCWVSEGVIEFLGEQDDVRPALEDCHVFVLPSYREGTPRSVLEAMSVGRAVITTDTPGCRETVIDGENGFLVRAGSSKSLFYAMEKFILQPELVEVMEKKSRKIAEEKYDVNKVNQHMLKIMEIL